MRKWNLGDLKTSSLFNVLAVAVAILCIIAISAPGINDWIQYSRVRIGMTEGQVIEKLGRPYLIYTKENAPVDYYLKDWTHEKRLIGATVYIYKRNMVAYIYFNKLGIVEYVSTGKT